MARPRAPRLLLSAWLAFWAGYADVITFVRYEAFSASMSGNVVLIGRSLMSALGHDYKFSIFFYLAILSCYSMGSVTYHVLFQRLPARAATLAGLAYCIVAVVVDTFFNLYSLRPARKEDEAWFICGLTPIFGVQAAVSTSCCLSNPTTAVASHLDNFSRLLAKLPSGRLSREERDKAVSSLVALTSFILGAFVGDAVFRSMDQGRWCYIMVGPAVALALLACDCAVGPSVCEPKAEPRLEVLAAHGDTEDSATEKSCSDRESGSD